MAADLTPGNPQGRAARAIRGAGTSNSRELEAKFGELGHRNSGNRAKTSSGVGIGFLYCNCGRDNTWRNLLCAGQLSSRHKTLPRPLPHQGYSQTATLEQVKRVDLSTFTAAKLLRLSHSPTTLCDRDSNKIWQFKYALKIQAVSPILLDLRLFVWESKAWISSFSVPLAMAWLKKNYLIKRPRRRTSQDTYCRSCEILEFDV